MAGSSRKASSLSLWISQVSVSPSPPVRGRGSRRAASRSCTRHGPRPASGGSAPWGLGQASEGVLEWAGIAILVVVCALLFAGWSYISAATRRRSKPRPSGRCRARCGPTARPISGGRRPGRERPRWRRGGPVPWPASRRREAPDATSGRQPASRVTELIEYRCRKQRARVLIADCMGQQQIVNKRGMIPLEDKPGNACCAEILH